MSPTPICRSCGAALRTTFVDLGMSPLSGSLVDESALHRMEPFYPLHAYVCDECFLVQLEELVSPDELFGEYAYFSSYSETWVEHARRFVEMAISRFGLDEHSSVCEIASNDGYLLQHFAPGGITPLGIEPASNVARAAQARGIETLVRFFSSAVAQEIVQARSQADLVIGNNVLAHTPALEDFVEGLAKLLAPHGTISLEFPHLLRLIEQNQFDTIYHEHFSYFSLWSVARVLEAQGLEVYDVEELATHGGSLRIYAGHASAHRPTKAVAVLRERELAEGVTTLSTYMGFSTTVAAAKRGLLRFLTGAKNAGFSIVAYGAPAKGNTLLNFCGIGTDVIDFAVDRNPYKQGKYTPGMHIPIRSPDALVDARPDFVLILPWNLRDEIIEQIAFVREWGGRFVVPIPRVEVVP
jgi:SAM-dependent methyltransferase